MRPVLLIQPAETAPDWPYIPRAVEPMGLLYVSGAFQQYGVETELLDLQLGYGTLRAALDSVAAGRYSGIGVALASQACLENALEIAVQVRQVNHTVPLFTGGVFASINARWLLESHPEFDAVVVGEGEAFAAAFAQRGSLEPGLPGMVDRATLVQQEVQFPVALFTAPPVWPDRRLMPLVVARGESPSVVASRGCGGGCSFCCSAYYYGSRWKGRTVEDVQAELAALVQEGVGRDVHLVDDNLFGHVPGCREWSLALLEALAEFSPRLRIKTTCRLDDLDESLLPVMQRAGIRLLKIGVETFSEETQRIYGKRISREEASRKLDLLTAAGMDVSLGFIMFDPYCRLEDLQVNLDFLRQYPKCWGRNLLRSRLIAYRGTRIERHLERDGLAVSRDIFGTQWRFRDGRVHQVQQRLEGWLRQEILPVENYIYQQQKTAMQQGRPPASTRELSESLQTCWLDLFTCALTDQQPSESFYIRLRQVEASAVDIFGQPFGN
jgi:radical SAM superfamily enzyme YgiQ (UPF0313 family)